MKQPLEVPPIGDVKRLLKWAGTKLSLSLATTLYFKPPPDKCADGILKAYQRYLELCEPQLTWFADETGKKYREARPDVLRIPFDRVQQALDSKKLYSWGAFAGKHHRHAAPYQFKAILNPDEWGLSWFRAAFSAETFRDDPATFVRIVKDLSSDNSVLHGLGGLSFSESMVNGAAQENEGYLIPAAMRFAGVEVEGDGMSAHCCHDATKGVNWLTLISDPFVKRLGGEKTLRAQLSEAIEIHRLPWGLMIQAGPRPELGDVNAGERLLLYREVSNALRPVRVAVHWNLGVEFEEKRTRQWIGRFD